MAHTENQGHMIVLGQPLKLNGTHNIYEYTACVVYACVRMCSILYCIFLIEYVFLSLRFLAFVVGFI